MRLTKVMLVNFKGQTVAYNLGPRTILTGPMGAGKTAVLQAITLALLGHVPHGDKPMKRPVDSLRFGSDDGAMEVTVWTDTGLAVTRTFSYGEASCNARTTLLLPDGGTASDPEKTIRQELGCDPLLLNIGDFLSWSPEEKYRYLFGLAVRMDQGGSETPDLRKKALAMCPQGFSASWPPHVAPFDGLLSLMAALRDAISSARRERTRTRQASAKLARERADLGRTGGKNLSELKAEREKVLEEIASIRETMARDEQRRVQAEKRKRQIAGLKEKKACAEEEIGRLDAERKALKEAVAQKSEILEAMQPPAAPPNEDTFVSLRAKAERLEQEIERITAARERWADEPMCPVAPSVQCPAGSGIADYLDAAYQDAGNDLLAVNEELRQAEEEEKAWEAYRRAGEETARLKERLTRLDAERNRLADGLKKLDADLAALREEETESNERYGGLADPDALAAEKAGAEAELARLNQEIERAEAERSITAAMARAQKEAVEAEDRLQMLQEALRRLGSNGLAGEVAQRALRRSCRP